MPFLAPVAWVVAHVPAVSSAARCRRPSAVWRRVALLAAAVLIASGALAACSPRAEVGIAKVTTAPQVDGVRSGYPGEPLRVAGAEVSVVHNGEMVYVHLSAPAQGWLAAGFNRSGGAMDGANLILGILGAEGEFDVQNHVGRGFAHGPVPSPVDFAAHVSRQGDRTVLEFAYPLRFPGENDFALTGLASGETVLLVVAYHRSAASFLKHSSRGAVALRVQ